METGRFASALIAASGPRGSLGSASGDLPRLLAAIRLMADRTISGTRLFLEWGPRGSSAAFDLGTRRYPAPNPIPPDAYPFQGDPPPGDVVVVRMDRWPISRVSLETFRDGERYGHLPETPSTVFFCDGRAQAGWWLDGTDITTSFAVPVTRLVDATTWPAPYDRLGRCHPRLLELATAAEEDGLAVVTSAYHDGISMMAYSPGKGAPYRLIKDNDFRRLRAPPAERNLLAIDFSGGEDGEAKRYVGGVPHGTTKRAPAVWLTYGDGSREHFFDAGWRTDPPSEDVIPAP